MLGLVAAFTLVCGVWWLFPDLRLVHTFVAAESIDVVAINADATVVAGGGLDGTIYLWDAQSGQSLHVLSVHQGKVQALALTSDGQSLVSGGADSAVWLWDVDTGESIRQLLRLPQTNPDQTLQLFTPDGGTVPFASGVFSVAISPDDRMVAAGGDHGALVIGQIEQGNVISMLQGHENPWASYDVRG